MAVIILSGGLSSRMGRNKALLPAEGTTLLQSLVSRFSEELGPVIVVLRQRQNLSIQNAVVTRDVLNDAGPLGGLHAGLLAAPDDVNLALACDMPFANVELARHILSRANGYDAVVPKLERGIEPLFAAYRKACIADIEFLIEAGKRRMRDLLDQVRTLYLDESELRYYEPDLHSFINVNTPEDYTTYLMLSGVEPGPAP
ncbi:MAG: molybdenum cofactor guanylyltransferase [Armatimonadota bacterium]|nr:molybdenum cofactor guanylyltransferase [Armatimonadota bacterium]